MDRRDGGRRRAVSAKPAATIRRAVPADAAAIAAIGAETFAETFANLYPPEDLATFLAEAHGEARARADLADPAKALWLAEDGGEVIGYALAGPCHLPHSEVTGACGELERIYLKAGRQGGGIGARLFAEAMAWLERDGPRRIWIGVWSENHGAQRFYARHGFEVVGTYAFVVGRTRDHEFIMRRG
jgi:ribosomal protein S18 acetylase RimI-like enzyme